MRASWFAVALLAALSACGGGETPAPTDEAQTSTPEVEFWEAFRGAKQAERQGEVALAISLYDTALQLKPDHGDTLYYLSQARYGRGEVAAALRHLEHLAELEPRALRPWQQLSALWGQPVAGFAIDLDAAAEAVSRALDLNPSASRPHLLAARWAAYRGDRAAALASLHTALGHNAKLWEAYLLWLWIDPDAAVEIRARVVEQLCDGDEAHAPACASHAALHVALAAAGEPGAGALLIGAADPSVGSGGAAAKQVSGSVLARHSPEVRAGVGIPGASGPTAPWRAAVVEGPMQRGVVVLPGASNSLTYFRLGGIEPKPRALPGLPDVLNGAALAAADFDGDGVDDLFVANVAIGPQGSNQIGGVVLRGLGGGQFAPTGQTIPGPLVAAVASDLDGDAMPDLLVARAPGAAAMANYLGSSPGAGAPGASVDAVVALWRNRSGTLVLDRQVLPTSPHSVQDLAVGDFDGDGVADVYLATGSLAPEYLEPDRLWLRRDDGFVDASERLGTTRFASSLRVWNGGVREVIVLRGGLVPADPQRLLRVVVAAGEEAAEK